MKGMASFLTSTALSGLLILLPLAVLFVAVTEIIDLLEGMAIVAEIQLPLPPLVNALILVAVIALAVLAACVLTGVMMMTGPGKRLGNFVEKAVVERVPLLGLIRNLTMSVTGLGSALKPVEADIHGSGATMLGFLVETLADGRHVVFVPSSPAVTLGHTYLVSPERVRLLDTSITPVVNAISQWGVGAGELFTHGAGK